MSRSDQDLARGLEALERELLELRRRRTRHSSDDGLGVLLDDLGRGHQRQAERLWHWLGPRLGSTAAEALSAPEAAPAAGEDGSRVLQLTRVAPDLVTLRISRPAGFSYTAGQHVKLSVGGINRTYSLVSAPHEPHLEFFIELPAGGAMAGAMAKLREGDPVEVSAAKGDLHLSAGRSQHVLVATVTGIAPHLSLLRDHLHQGPPRGDFHILYGASYQDELAYSDELAAMAIAHPERIHFMPAVSRPQESRNTGWRGATGRVADLVQPYLQQQGLGPRDTALYACGNAQMVAAVVDRFRPQGFEIHQEPY
jgi:ferredoxin--NADP+ reductase